MLRKCSSEVAITTALIAYHDTPIAQDLPSPAELFFNRRINSRLGIMFQPGKLEDVQKQKLYERRSAHLSEPGSQNDKPEYYPHQHIWFTEDGSAEWKPGFIESKSQYPDSYWIITASNDRRLRRNVHDLKPRYSLPSYRPSLNTGQHSPRTTPLMSHGMEKGLVSTAPTPQGLISNPATSTHETVVPPTNKKANHSPDSVTDESLNLSPQSIPRHSPVKTRYGRQVKQNRSPDFVYLAKRDSRDTT